MIKKVLKWILCMFVVFTAFVLIRYYIIAPTIVKHNSMQPTLQENQRLFLDRTYQISHRPLKVGELVAFEAPSKTYTKADADQKNPVAVYDNNINGIINKFSYYVLEINKTNYIKRVIALEGDKVKIINGKVYVNSTLQEEAFLPEDVQTDSGVFYDLVVPEGYVFVLGDNRPNSLDSRELGCIPLEKIEGVVFFRFWPFNVFGKIS